MLCSDCLLCVSGGDAASCASDVSSSDLSVTSSSSEEEDSGVDITTNARLEKNKANRTLYRQWYELERRDETDEVSGAVEVELTGQGANVVVKVFR